MRARKIERRPSEKIDKDCLITRQIEGLEIAIGRRLFFYELGADNPYSVVLIEGYSELYNFIYGRIEHGYLVGRPLQGNIGDSAVCLLPLHLEGFKVTCTASPSKRSLFDRAIRWFDSISRLSSLKFSRYIALPTHPGLTKPSEFELIAAENETKAKE